MPLVFKDIKDSSVVNVAGCCADSPQFAMVVNDACRRLLRKGDWVGTVAPIHICVKNGCLVMPRYVQTIRKLNSCNRPLAVGNLWYNFIQNRDWCNGQWAGNWQHARDCNGILTAQGQTSCYTDIPGDGWLVRAYPTTVEDVSKTVKIFGVDNGNQPLRTDNGDGTWSDGITISLNLPFGSSSIYVRRIDYGVKEITQGQVRLYAYNPTTGALVDLAVWDPGETTPTYTRYHINTGHLCCSTGTGCCGTVHSIVALVKLRFIPAKFDTDLVIPDNLDAIKDMVDSIKLREAHDMEGAINFEQSAIRELQRQLNDEFDDDTFSANNNVFGGMTFHNQAF